MTEGRRQNWKQETAQQSGNTREQEMPQALGVGNRSERSLNPDTGEEHRHGVSKMTDGAATDAALWPSALASPACRCLAHAFQVQGAVQQGLLIKAALGLLFLATQRPA